VWWGQETAVEEVTAVDHQLNAKNGKKGFFREARKSNGQPGHDGRVEKKT